MTGAHTKARDVAPVKPSSRDPIAQWLDVFTSLLALPAGESERIRDELEDHLRTRVDDLLILGMSEPEAVQKAVTELGETAQLARNFKAVRTHSRRRIAMHTALFAAAGLALTVSVAGFLPRANTAPVTSPSAIVDAQPEDQHHHGILDQDLPAGKLGDMLQMLADAGNARIFVHWSSLEPLGLDAETEVRAIPAKGLEHGKVRQLINSALGLEGLDELAARVEGDLVEIGTVRYFDRIETVLVDYDISFKVNQSSQSKAQATFVMNNGVEIYNTIEPQIWQTGMGSVSQDNGTLTVRAPKRVQAQVEEYLNRLRERQREIDAERQSQAKELFERSLLERVEQASQMEKSILELKQEVQSFQRAHERISHEYWLLKMEIQEFEKVYAESEDEQARLEARDRLISAQVKLESIDAERDRLENQIAASWVKVDAWSSHLDSLRQGMQTASNLPESGR